jgi:acetyl esterase/lipase
MKTTIQLPNGAAADIYQSTNSQPQKTVIYLHGGGLIYGSKNDLTEELKQTFMQNDYQVIALDYLLAPNTSLPIILTTLEESITLLKEEVIQTASFGLCGRSAGSFLMLQLVKRGVIAPPDFLVNFYGYTDLTFIDSSRKLIDQTITEQDIQQIDQQTPTWDDPFLRRVLLYHYAVQHQTTSTFYGLTKQMLDAFTITEDELQSFPTCFSSASSSDEEIPFHYSKMLGKSIPNSTFVPVYYLEHDFLKRAQDTQVQNVLKRLNDWLQSIV